MNVDTGYFHLHIGAEWPSFQLVDVEIGADGGLRLKLSGRTFASRGLFLAGPFEVFAEPTRWYRVQAFARDVPAGTHVQLFTQTRDTGTPAFDVDPLDPFPSAEWEAQPRDVLDVLVRHPARTQLWIGGLLRSGGDASPLLQQMRIDYGRQTYLESLPAIYGEDDTKRDFLERFLSLTESVLGGLQQSIADLPRLFDPAAAPGGEFPSWLTWLAGWLAWDVDEGWSDADARAFLAMAFELYGWRGTIEGLRRYLKVYAGVEAHIAEPALDTSLWLLNAKSMLGFTTMLAPGAAQGAVLDATAVLDRSFLTSNARLGGPLFDELAHRFCVHVYCAELTRPGTLNAVRAVLDREKPAHTEYHLCVIEPRMRVGAQARVGIDAVVADGPPPAYLGGPLDTSALPATVPPCEKEK